MNPISSLVDNAMDTSSFDNLSIHELRARLREAEETLEAIRRGAVDAIVLGDDSERQIYKLDSADRPYRDLVEQMQEGAVMMSDEGVVLYANQRAGEILRQAAGQMVGKKLIEYFSASQQARIQQLISDSCKTPVRGEFGLVSGGEEMPVLFSFNSLKQDFGQERVICAVLTDLTQQRQIEARLNQAQKMEAVGQLTGGLAHDFNNLLQAVHGNLELVKRMPADAERVARWAENGLQAVDRGAKLTAQLLAFARSQQLQLRAVAVTELVKGMADLFVRTLGTSVEVQLALDCECGDVIADATQLELAILNLAINARDAMPDGGRLTITTRPRQISGEFDLADGAYIELSVKDTGTGMPVDIMARAFEPFFTTKEVGSGTGLGLAQVYGICRQAGGHVSISSEMNRGTTVSLLLRCATEHATPSSFSTSTIALPTARNSPRILVVDDDPGVSAFVIDALGSLGYRVGHADSGEAGLRELEKEAPDLVLLDFAMPVLDGARVAKLARDRNFTMPIIFMSGYADTSTLKAVVGSDIAMLRKPFTISSLAEIIASTLAVYQNRKLR